MRVLKKIGSTEFLLLCGVIGPLLFIVVLLIEGATRPGYSALRNYGSDLELSNQGWEQSANFIVVIWLNVRRNLSVDCLCVEH